MGFLGGSHRVRDEASRTNVGVRAAARLAAVLRRDAVGGMVLIAAAVVAIAWANSPWAAGYGMVRDARLGYAPWGLRLSVGDWAADGLLAVFFFVIGLELKREFVTGDLRRARTAVVPIAAAVGGVIVPALIYLVLVRGDAGLCGGWAIPTATDVAFAVAVLALVGPHLPGILRVFLLTLAVVDDLIAVAIIAIFYTDRIHVVALLGAIGALVLYGVAVRVCHGFLTRHRSGAWWILLPIGVVAWGFMHASGIHATVAGFLLGFTVPAQSRRADGRLAAGAGLAEQFEHRFRPLSSGLAVPAFAFFAAGVPLGGGGGVVADLTHPLVLAVVVALVVGKPAGILTATWLAQLATAGRSGWSMHWADLVGLGLLGGIGFTVSLLIAGLSFGPDPTVYDHAKIAILAASLCAALFACAVLLARNRHYRAAQDRTKARATAISGSSRAR